MSEEETIESPWNPQRAARKWVDLYREGRVEEAAALTAECERRNREAFDRNLEEFLQAREAARK